MFQRRVISSLFIPKTPLNLTLSLSPSSSFCSSSEAGKNKTYTGLGRKVVSIALLSLTGGVALSALDDLIIYYGCSSKALEKASQNQKILEALGEPIVRGPWYNASLAVAHKRHSVSCTFPVSGPQGNDDSWFTFLHPRDWDILIMDAMVHNRTSQDPQQTFRISLSDGLQPKPVECKECVASGTRGTKE
ncbi:uncharacterized protein LOC18444173 isoform X2 [Amborella trichopoda]|uniref:uncharacterized protein LOC18444173 isoform X2 n=1 Tax=Amborella trichopoda TaxID=13333 RepID=UPI0009BD0479|nr:uncharacterized protein LOC18444173 isoform X2 [Amborella trichopoda]|eukprot:XP_020529210.1 uncharacterized protein LOC18444173 isoform X2 [Amborella trichopoda]